MRICLETLKKNYWENSSEHCNMDPWNWSEPWVRLEISQGHLCGLSSLSKCFPAKEPRKPGEKNQNRFAPNKFQFPLGFLISEGKASLLGAIKTWPGSWDPKRTVMAPPYWDGGAGFSVKRLPVYQRWHLIALHSPSLPLAKLSKTGQPTRAAENADDELSSASELRSTLDWFNELMRRRPAELFLIRLMVHTWYLSSFFQPDLTCQTILMNSQEVCWCRAKLNSLAPKEKEIWPQRLKFYF